MPIAAKADVQAAARRMMVDCQLRTYDITNHALLAAFDTVPREAFVAPACDALAYADRDLPSRGNTQRAILAPMILARMIQALNAGAGAKILDVAGGAGYGAAILAATGAHVTALESDWLPGDSTALAQAILAQAILAQAILAQAILAQASGGTLARVSGRLDQGHAAGAPYDAILVHGAVAREPSALLAQLREGGRLVCGWQVGETTRIVCFERFGAAFKKLPLFDARVPALAEFAAVPAFVF